jgi:hypothetical protein
VEAWPTRRAGLAEYLGGVPEEPVGVGGLEVLELRPADSRIDPLLGLVAVRVHRVRIEFERVEPVFNALSDGVGGRRLDASLDLLVQLVELVFDLDLGLAASRSRRGDVDLGHVPAGHANHRDGAPQVGRFICHGYGLRLAGEQGDVVVLPRRGL